MWPGMAWTSRYFCYKLSEARITECCHHFCPLSKIMDYKILRNKPTVNV
jgi:hypothetical protein